MSFKKFKDAAVACDVRNCSTEEEHYYFRVTVLNILLLSIIISIV
jgi:hypothetical protein